MSLRIEVDERLLREALNVLRKAEQPFCHQLADALEASKTSVRRQQEQSAGLVQMK